MLTPTEFCPDNESEEWMIAIGNEGTDAASAASVSADQVGFKSEAAFLPSLQQLYLLL